VNGFGWAWLIWVVVLLGSFGVIEALAIFTRKGKGERLDTLTSYLQHLTKSAWIRHVAAGFLAGFIVWFIFHLWI
jgi:hypothetical protein